MKLSILVPMGKNKVLIPYHKVKINKKYNVGSENRKMREYLCIILKIGLA